MVAVDAAKVTTVEKYSDITAMYKKPYSCLRKVTQRRNAEENVRLDVKLVNRCCTVHSGRWTHKQEFPLSTHLLMKVWGFKNTVPADVNDDSFQVRL